MKIAAAAADGTGPVSARTEPLRREAFEDFYRRTAPALRSYICRVAATSAIADDVLQEAYVRLLTAPPLDEPRRKAYLYRTATNLIVDQWRTRAREQRRAEKWFRRGDAPPPDFGRAHDVERLFGMLKVQERALLWLAYVEGAAHREIAAILDLSEASVRVLLLRARRNMEAILRKHGYGGEAGQ